MPKPVDALPWGSISMTRVGSPTAASAVPRLMAVVVLPTPPFWFATTRTLGLASFMRSQLADFQDDARRVAQALVLPELHPPRFTGLGQFSLYILTLEEQAGRRRAGKMLCIVQKERQRRAGARGDDIERGSRRVFCTLVLYGHGQVEPLRDRLEEAALFCCRLDQGDLNPAA